MILLHSQKSKENEEARNDNRHATRACTIRTPREYIREFTARSAFTHARPMIKAAFHNPSSPLPVVQKFPLRSKNPGPSAIYLHQSPAYS